MRQELVPEPGAFAGALDQTGDVGEDELAYLPLEHSQDRRERRERVARDLRRGAREPCQQRGLAGIGQPHEADIGEQPQPQIEPALLARKSALCEARCLARGGREALVPLSPTPASCDGRTLARGQQLPAALGEIALRADDLGAGRDPKRELFAIRAMAQGAFAVASAAGVVVRLAVEALK